MSETWDWRRWKDEAETIGQIIAECKTKAGRENVNISWQWNDRFTSRMGDASPKLGRVRFSKPLWPRASEAERRETVIHEVAHIFAPPTLVMGRRGRRKWDKHGRDWKRMMVLLGGTTQRTHNVDRTGLSRRQARFSIPCPGCRQEITFGPRVRLNWIRQRQVRCCRRCRTRIDWTLAQGATRVSA